MQHPGQARPGDRARNDYDRQLMLDALLSARRQLYLSWAGHSVRDNSPQPPLGAGGAAARLPGRRVAGRRPRPARPPWRRRAGPAQLSPPAATL